MQTRMFINGQLEAGQGESFTVFNPSTGAELVRIPEASPAQVAAAVNAADKALAGWARTAPKDRAAILLKIADRVEENAEELARLESNNCGKPYSAALNDEIPGVADVFRFFAGAARCLGGSAAAEYLPGHTSMIRRDPVGVIAQITPWNYPLMMAAWKMAPALAAGNTLVLKPSEITPLTSLRFFELIGDLLPPGVVNIVFGRGNTVGQPLVSADPVRMISLTGSIATGQKMLEVAAQTLKRTHLELGGKAPVIIFDDADIESAVEGIRAFGYYNAGQDCTAACRIYTQDKKYENFVADLASAVSTIKHGLQDEEGVELGPLVSSAHRDRVSGFLDRVRSREAHGSRHRRQERRGQWLLLRADGRRRRHPGRRDRAQGGVRAGGVGVAIQRCRPGHRLRQRQRLRPGVLGVDLGHQQGDARFGRAAIWLHLGEHPLHAGQ